MRKLFILFGLAAMCLSTGASAQSLLRSNRLASRAQMLNRSYTPRTPTLQQVRLRSTYQQPSYRRPAAGTSSTQLGRARALNQTRIAEAGVVRLKVHGGGGITIANQTRAIRRHQQPRVIHLRNNRPRAMNPGTLRTFGATPTVVRY